LRRSNLQLTTREIASLPFGIAQGRPAVARNDTVINQMKVGLTYDLRDDYPPYINAPPDYYAEFDTEENINHLATAIESLGHQVCRIGNVYKLMNFIAQGGSVNIVFNMAEGLWGRGREAQIPAILEAYRIPCTGSDPLTLALCLDKAMTKRIWQSAGLPTPDFCIVADVAELDQARDDMPSFPLFVKPVHEGSSKGIGIESIVESDRELHARVEWVLTWYQQPALVEEFLPGREFTVGILGNGRGAKVLGVAEINVISRGGVNDLTQKEEWEARALNKFTAVESTSLRSVLSELALQAYLAVGCRDLGRLEVRLDKNGDPQLLEINPLVGLHPTHSALPIIATQAGLSYEELIGEILEHAINRWSLVLQRDFGRERLPKSAAAG
jgi:D-alanine-D-alanine ligase